MIVSSVIYSSGISDGVSRQWYVCQCGIQGVASCIARRYLGGAFEYTDPAPQDKGVSFPIRSESINMRVTLQP